MNQKDNFDHFDEGFNIYASALMAYLAYYTSDTILIEYITVETYLIWHKRPKDESGSSFLPLLRIATAKIVEVLDLSKEQANSVVRRFVYDVSRNKALALVN